MNLQPRFDKRMTILIESDIWDRLGEIASKRSLTASDVAREAIYERIRKENKKGKIKDVRLFDSALTKEQVEALYEEGKEKGNEENS